MNKLYKAIWKQKFSQFVVISANHKAKSKHISVVKTLKSIGALKKLGAIIFLISITTPSLGADGGVYINDGTDSGCIKIVDSGGLSAVASTDACNVNLTTQTTHSVFFGPAGNANDALGSSSSLSVGQYLYVNGGKIGLTDLLGGTYSMRLGSLQTLGATIGLNSIAIGSSQTSTSAGSATIAAGNNSISLGSNASSDANSAQAIAQGINSKITYAQNGIAIGSSAAVNGAANNLSTNSIALGSSATVAAGATNAIALGSSATVAASATNAIAQGTSAMANAISAIALGNTAVASASKSIALGDSAKAQTADSVAIGSSAVATGGKAVSIGAGNTANGNGSVAIGDPNNATGDGSVAIGKDNTANGSGAIAMGNTSNAQGQGAVALGYQSSAAAAGSVSLGDNAHSFATNALALGSGAIANYLNDVALGAGSTTNVVVKTTSVTIAGNTYNFAGVNPTSTVSIGSAGNERTLTNLAAGRISSTSTDAINGSQLYSTNQAVETLNSQIAQGLNFAANSGNVVHKKLGDTLSILGSGVKADSEYDSTNIKTTTDINGNVIIGFAKDASLTSLTTGNSTLNTDGLVIVNGPSVTTNGIDAGNKKITDVAAGEISSSSQDAINGSQFYSFSENLAQVLGGNASYANNQIYWTNIGGTGQNSINDAIQYVNNQIISAAQGWNVVTDSGIVGESTIKSSDTLNINGDKLSGVNVTNSGNDITVALADQIKVGSGNNAVSVDGSSGTITTGNIAIDGSNGNISAGQVTVNGAAGTVNGLTNTTWDFDNIVSGQAATEDQLKLVVDRIDSMTTPLTIGATTVTAGNNIIVTDTENIDGSTNYQIDMNENMTFKSIDAGVITVGDVRIDQNGINAGDKKVSNVVDGAITSTSTDAINGAQLYTSNTNIYKYLGGGANYDTNTGPSYTVGESSYNNVGGAIDALNQADQVLESKINNMSNNLSNALSTVNTRIDEVEKTANAGIAAAMALESAPYVAGKYTYAAGAAYHGGETALGVTLRRTANNGRWSITGGITAATQGSPSVRIGISGVID